MIIREKLTTLAEPLINKVLSLYTSAYTAAFLWLMISSEINCCIRGSLGFQSSSIAAHHLILMRMRKEGGKLSAVKALFVSTR